MKGLYFYKLASPYSEDVTKDCKLTVNEIDHNFITLKDSIIDSEKKLSEQLVSDFILDNEKGQLTIELYDGKTLTVNVSNYTKDYSIEYDKINGNIYVHHDNVVDRVEGLVTEDNIYKFKTSTIVTDETLIGDNVSGPLGISVLEKNAYFRPVEKLIDKTSDEYLPSANHVKKGDRYLTLEYLNPHGYLYNFQSASRIAEDAGKGWRVPTKDDWDGMLNAIELCDENKNHGAISNNHMFGKVAGKLLKANEEWFKTSGNTCNIGCNCDSFCNDLVEDYIESEDEPTERKCIPDGVDAYSMSILPSGYGDGCLGLDYFGMRAKFWTSTVTQVSDHYTKRFDYDKGGVVQVSDSPNAVCSLRLVKDYTGDNFYGIEVINSMPYKTVLMPSATAKSGYAIWMASNVSFEQSKYHPVEPNAGENVSKTKVYYINEWDGFEWLKRRLSDGDALVVKNGHDGTINNEFRLINNELVNVNNLIVKEVINKYDVIIEDITIHLDQVEDKLEKEITDRIEAVKSLTEVVENEIATREEADKNLLSALELEKQQRIENDTEIKGIIENEVNKLKESIQQEHDSRLEDVRRLQDSINEETNARIESDEKLLEAINKEIETRTREIEELWIASDNNFGNF